MKSTKKAKGQTATESADETAVVQTSEDAPVDAGAGEVQELTVELDANAAAPVEGAAEGEGKTKKKATRAPAVPEDLKKGNRFCAACGTPESTFLEKNSRYSLCQGVDVYCYRKGHRVIYGQTLEQVQAQFPDKVGKTDGGTPPQPLIQEVGGTGIKAGILVRGAVAPPKREKKATTAAAETAGATTTTEAVPVGETVTEAAAATQ